MILMSVSNKHKMEPRDYKKLATNTRSAIYRCNRKSTASNKSSDVQSVLKAASCPREVEQEPIRTGREHADKDGSNAGAETEMTARRRDNDREDKAPSGV